MALLASLTTALPGLVHLLTSLSAGAGVEEESSGLNPYLVGGGALVALLALLVMVVSIGGGREHS